MIIKKKWKNYRNNYITVKDLEKLPLGEYKITDEHEIYTHTLKKYLWKNEINYSIKTWSGVFIHIFLEEKSVYEDKYYWAKNIKRKIFQIRCYIDSFRLGEEQYKLYNYKFIPRGSYKEFENKCI